MKSPLFVNHKKTYPHVLTLAGSDPSGGAGIQADIQVFARHGVYPFSVITAITAQNTRGVTQSYEIPLQMIESQMQSVFEDFHLAAVKTGMLSSGKVVRRIAALLSAQKVKNLVVDPVILSKNGYPLLNANGLLPLRSKLFPLARLVTPNIDEAEVLSGMRIRSLANMEQAARIILDTGCQAVLVKGGHLRHDRGVDVLCEGKNTTHFKTETLSTPHTHGTGCVYSAAITAHLAKGASLGQAITRAKLYITEAIRQGLSLGRGRGPVNPWVKVASLR